MEPPEIKDNALPDVYEYIGKKLIVSYYKDYPNFFYINIPYIGWCIPVPIKELDQLEEVINIIRAK